LQKNFWVLFFLFFGSLHGSKQANKHAPNSISFRKRKTYIKPFDFFCSLGGSKQTSMPQAQHHFVRCSHWQKLCCAALVEGPELTLVKKSLAATLHSLGGWAQASPKLNTIL
jgi:hypothetical protein